MREIERRIAQAGERVDGNVELPAKPNGIPDDVEEHIKLMYDLMALAWQTEITRISTFMMAKELSNAVYPKSGIRDSFHILSHHSNNEDNKARFAVLNRYHAGLLAYFLDRLQKAPDGDGTLLDHSLVLYGSGMSDGNSHNHDPLPIVLAGRGGRHAAGQPAPAAAAAARRCRTCCCRCSTSWAARKSTSATAPDGSRSDGECMTLTRRMLVRGAIAAGAAASRLAAAVESTAQSPILRAIPSTGERIPVVGIGANAYDVESAEDIAMRREVLREFPVLGGRVIDSARGYGRSEVVIGQLLAELGNRERFFIATKPVSAPQGTGVIDRPLIDESFTSLRTRVIDLLQVHSLVRFDDVMPLLREYQQQKRVRYIGATTAAPRQHAEFLAVMRKHRLDFVQVDYSIANREAAKDLLPLAQELGIAVLNNVPLGGRGASLFPRVAGKPLPAFAAEFGASTWAQFMLKYNLSQPAITAVIPGTTNVEHLRDNQAAGRGDLPDAALRRRMEQYWDAL